MGFSSLASSANHQVLAISLSCILVIATWVSSRTRAAFRSSVVSIYHCSVFNGLSVPENTVVAVSWNRSHFLVSVHHVSSISPGVRSPSASADFLLYSIGFSSDHCSSYQGHLKRGQNHHNFPIFQCLSWSKDNRKIKISIWKNFRSQRMEYQERRNNFVLVVGMYSQGFMHSSCKLISH